MKLKVLVPTEVLVNEEVAKVIAEADNGHFCLLPRHIDFLASLVPGILAYTDLTGREWFVAVDEGLLVKRDQEVLVSTRQAIPGGDLEQLRETVKEEFETLDERQRICHSAIASLEAKVLPALFPRNGRTPVVNEHDDEVRVERDLERQVADKQERKLLARRQRDQSIAFGLGMFGLVGWSIAAPALVGIAVGLWIDSRWPSQLSWTVMLLVAGVAIGCFNAWRWVSRESQESPE